MGMGHVHNATQVQSVCTYTATQVQFVLT